MSLKIDASGLLSRHFLQLRPDGIKFYDSSMIFGARRFSFAEINSVVLSPDHKLSFQVGNEVFSIQTKPDKARHQEAIAALVQGLEASRMSLRAGGAS